MRKFLVFLTALSLLIIFNATSQIVNPEALTVEKVVHRLFEGMQKGDSALLHSTFSDKVTLATISLNKDGSTKLTHEDSIQDFLNAVASPHKDVWYEETWNYTTQIDGAFAQVWCDYAFYLGNQFSHCGVDAFQLVKINNEWKIFHLADTRRREGCKVPDSISAKHK
jgi:hypothetical protein